MAEIIYPDISKVLSLLKNSDNRDDDSRNPVELYRLLRKIPDINPRVSGHILTRNTAVSSFGWSIVGLDNSSKNIIPETTVRLQKAINTLISRHALTHIYGNQVYELEWELINNTHTPKVIIPNYEIYHCFNNKFYLRHNDKSTLLNQDTTRLLDYSATSNVNGGIMRNILITEILRLDATKEQANFIKKLKGILQIINKGGDDDATIAAQAAQTAIQENYLVTSDLIEFKLNSIASSHGPFKDVIEALNADISIAFLGQANTTELPNNGGSRAALQVMKLLSADIHYNDIVHFEDFINNQLLKYDYQLNFGMDKEVPYKFQINLIEETDRESAAIAVTEMLKTGLTFKKSEIYGLLQMSIPEPTDDVIKLETAGV